MWLELIAAVLLLGTGVAGFGWLRTARRLDITTREREDLAKSALVIEVERQMLELVAKGASLSEVLDTLTRAIEQLSPESHCTIMLLDEEHRRYLSVASGPSLPQDYLQALNRLEIGPEVGACGSAAFRNETIVIDNIATDYRFAQARDFILSHGLRSCWSQPIRDSRNTVLGTFAIYRRKVASPRPEELRMTRVAAQLAGNAIERIRAEIHLRETVERLNLAETVARFGIWECNFQKDTMTLSAGLALMMERPMSQFELTRAEFYAMVHPQDRQALRDTINSADARTGTIQDEFRLVLPSGAIHWMRSRWCFEPGESPPTRASGAMIDITKEREEAVQAEQELERAEAATRIAHKAEKLEQDRNEILELVAKDQPLERIIAAMADAVASHLPGSLCSIKIEASDGSYISTYPNFPENLATALEQTGIASINPTLAAAPIHQLSDDARWVRFIQSSGQLPYRYYRAVPVVRSTRLTGMILSLFAEDRPDAHSEQTLLESWGRFASLAVERRGLYEQLSFRAQYDSLTELLNRAALYDRVDSWISANAVKPMPMALVYLDLDGFKQINDTHGHGAGDQVLQHVSAHILESVRKTDVVARLGGDEFVIVLPGVGEATEARRIADLVTAAVERPLAYADRELRIGVSYGISVYPADGDNTDALLKIADEDMYRAKLKRRNKSQASPADQPRGGSLAA
jgi:diguanylate cyclase (GGDEF)-like protein